MKFDIERELFLKPLQMVSGAVERRHTLPILANVLIKVSEGVLSLTGTDLEVELVSSVNLEGPSEDGEVTVPAKKLLDLCRGLSDHAVLSINQDGEKLQLKSGRSRFSLSTLPANDFPNLDDWSGEVEFSISQQELKRLLDATHFSMANQDVRYYLNGMSFETEGSTLRTVTTDGHRLALCMLDTEGANLPNKQVIVPRKGVLEIMRLVNDESDLMNIQFGSNHMRVSTSEFTMTSKLVDGRFPDYKRVLPQNGNKIVDINKEEFKRSLSRASILTNEKFKGVRVNIENGEIRITATNPEQEEAVEVVDVSYDGDALEIGFNVSYLIDILNTLSGDVVRLIFSDSNSSALVQEQNDDSALYVVMPMRL